MQVSVEAADGLERKINIEIPSSEVDVEYEKRLKTVGKTARLAGFRPGKIPMKVLQQNFGSRISEELISGLVQSSFVDALTQESLNPAGPPSIADVKWVPGTPLTYTAIIEVVPDVPEIDFGSLSFTKKSAEVNDDDVEKMIQTLRKQKMGWVEVDREAAIDDRVTMDFKGTINGEDFQGNEAKNSSVVLGSNRMIEGFENDLVGLKAGESKELSLTFPEDYQSKEVAGKPVVFDVTITKVEEGSLPELDAELFKAYGVDSDKVEDFTRDIRTNMERELSESLMRLNKNHVMDVLIEKSPFDIPQVMVVEEAKRMAAQAEQEATEALLANLAEPAKRRVTLGLLLADVVKKNSIQAGDEKIRSRVESIASSYEDPDEVINWYYADQQRLGEIQSVVLEDEVVDWVMEQGEVTQETVGFDDVMNNLDH